MSRNDSISPISRITFSNLKYIFPYKLKKFEIHFIEIHLVTDRDADKVHQKRRWLQITFANLSSKYTLRICS